MKVDHPDESHVPYVPAYLHRCIHQRSEYDHIQCDGCPCCITDHTDRYSPCSRPLDFLQLQYGPYGQVRQVRQVRQDTKNGSTATPRNGQPIEVLGQLNLLSSSSIAIFAMAHESSSKTFLEASVFIIYPCLKCALQSMRMMSHES